MRRRADEFIRIQRRFVTRISAELVHDPAAAGSPVLRDRLARARLIGAEIMLLPQISRPALALEKLAEFDGSLSDGQRELAGRLWRVRLLAYEKLGKIEDAARTIPAFVEADPVSAGHTLQTLYSNLSAQVKKLREAGDNRAAEPKAEFALVLAEQLMAWSRQNEKLTTPPERRLLAVQLAEANLEAGRHEPAREQFELLVSKDAGNSLPQEPLELRVLFGYAESLYQSDERSHALALFNRLATGLRPSEPIRWISLLRDLQCRTGLGQDPRSIIRVIKQQRFLFPDLGGTPLSAEFDKLQRENQRRADTG